MGRRKIKMEIVKDAASRLVTFSKRRNGLFKKANELAILCGADLAIVVFSPGGKPFSFGHPSVDTVTERFLRHLQDEGNGDDENEEAKSLAGGTSSFSGSKRSRRKGEKLNKKLMNLTKDLEETKKNGAAIDKAVEEKYEEYGLGPETGHRRKRDKLLRSLERMRENVKLRKRETEAAASLLVLAEKLQLKEGEDNNVAESDGAVASVSDGGEIRNGN